MLAPSQGQPGELPGGVARTGSASVGRPAVRFDPRPYVVFLPQPHARVPDLRLGEVRPAGKLVSARA